MNEIIRKPDTSRRRLLQCGGIMLAGVLTGCNSLRTAEQERAADAPPAFPWPWVKLDPMEAGSRSYRLYLEAGG